jgi:16S rRNA (adenine1518-N6/adenine1519-N6)-dimethyltransferase
MAQSKSEIQSLLAGAATEPRHRFGQNFMIDQNLVRLVAAAGGIETGDVVIEVGPGTGTLTEELLKSPASKIVAVEIDRNLAGLLRENFAGDERFHLIEGDALSGKHELNAELAEIIRAAQSPDFGKLPSGLSLRVEDSRVAARPTEPGRSPPRDHRAVKLVANLPYNIASPLVIDLLLAGVKTLAFTVQKEVADRLRAAVGSDAYGPLSVMAQLLAKVEMMRTLPAQAFWPMPKIESALVRMTRENQLGEKGREFGRFIQKIFSLRRKTLRKAMTMAAWPAEEMLGKAGMDGGKRPEEFSPAELRGLFETLKGPD